MLINHQQIIIGFQPHIKHMTKETKIHIFSVMQKFMPLYKLSSKTKYTYNNVWKPCKVDILFHYVFLPNKLQRIC